MGLVRSGSDGEGPKGARMRRPDPSRLERLLDDGEYVVAVVAATPHGALPDTVAAVIARSLGLRRRPATSQRRWDRTADAFVASASPIDPGRRRQVLLVLTEPSDRLVVMGLDRLGRPVESLWSGQAGDLADVCIEPARLLGVVTDALVFSVPPDGPWRFVLARPQRRSGRDLAARLAMGVRYSGG